MYVWKEVLMRHFFNESIDVGIADAFSKNIGISTDDIFNKPANI